MAIKERICKMSIKIGAGLLCILFFLPWLTVEGEGTFTGLTLIFNGVFWALALLVIPAVLLVLAIKDAYYNSLRFASIIGLLTIIVFEIIMDFAALDYIEYSLWPFFWASMALYVVIIGVIQYGIHLERKEIRRMMADTSGKLVLCPKCSKSAGDFWKNCPICSKNNNNDKEPA